MHLTDDVQATDKALPDVKLGCALILAIFKKSWLDFGVLPQVETMKTLSWEVVLGVFHDID